MTKKSTIALLILGLCASLPALPDPPDPEVSRAIYASAGTSPGLGGYVSDAEFDLVVAQVLSVSDAAATIAKPPHVILQVERVLRGRLRPGSLETLWIMDESMPGCGNMTPAEWEAHERYYAQRVKGPRVGKRFILAGSHGEDSLWHTVPQVRLAYDEALASQLYSQARMADSTKEHAASVERQRGAEQDASDARLRESADLRRLVRASTDILVAEVRRGETKLTVEERLYEAPHEAIAQTINASISKGYVRGDGLRVKLEGPENAVARLLNLAEEEMMVSDPTGAVGTYLCFLRRRALLPYDGGFIPMVPADPGTGILVANPELTRQVRGIIATESRKGPWSPLPPPECGARLSQFARLRGSDGDSIRVRILYARPQRNGGRSQSFVFGVGLQDRGRPFIPLCDPLGEWGWSDQQSSPYTVGLPRVAMAAWVGALASLPAKTLPADSVVAILTVQGVIGGTTRSAERRLSDRELAQVAEALTKAAVADSTAAWRINYWKHSFGNPLAPEMGWRLAGT